MKVAKGQILAGASILALIVAAASPVFAADAPKAADEPKVNQVEEIVVTALKREQTLQKAPATITAITAQTLSQAGVVDMKGVSLLVPGLVTVQNIQPIAQSYRVRGVGADPNIPTFEPDVGLFIDGVYMPRSGLGVDDLVDISRVEVLEGPQSTLYGKNVTGGVVNVVTKAPSATFESHFDATLSQFDSSKNALAERIDGSISGPITDHVLGRLSVAAYHQDDSYKNLQPGAGDANGWNRYAVRGELEFLLGPDTTLRLAAARSAIVDSQGVNPDLYIPGPTSKLYAIPAALHGVFPNISPCPDNNPNDRVICTTDPEHASGSTDVASATLTSKWGANTFTSITAFSDYRSEMRTTDIAQVLDPLVTYDDIQTGQNFTEELRLTSPGGEKLDWLTGAYFMRGILNRGDNGDTPTFVLGAAAPYLALPHNPPLPPAFKIGQPGDAGFLNSSAASDYWAIFGQGTYHFNDQFALTIGLRGQTEHKSASIDNHNVTSPLNPSGVNLNTALLTPTSVNAGFTNSLSNITWNATLEYHPDADSMLYLTYSRGAKSGGTNIGFGNAPDSARSFAPEYVDDYEVGGKFTLLDNRLRLALSAFHTVYHDYQNAGFVGAQFLVDNAKQVTVNGAEGNFAAVLGSGFTLNGGLTYLDAKYDTYTGGSCYFGAVPNALGQCNLSGDTLPLAPHWRSNLNVSYKRSVSFGEFYSRVDWSWSSSYMTNTNLDPREFQKAYSLINARVGVMVGNGLDVSVFANNLFNQTVVQQDAVSTLFGTDAAYQRFLAPPREIGITLRKTF